jgi:hypothetical protein
MTVLLFLVPVIGSKTFFLSLRVLYFTTVTQGHNHSGYLLPWHFYSSLYQWWDLNTFSLSYKSYVLQLQHQGTTILATLHYGNSTILNAHVLIRNFFTLFVALHFTILPLGHNHSGYLLPWQSYSFWYQWWYSNPFFLGLRVLYFATLLPRHNDSGYLLSWQL